MSEVNILHYGDFGKQADDEFAVLTSLGLEKETAGRVKVVGVIGNYTAAETRARLARSMLDAAGRPDIEVGIGEDPDPTDYRPYEFQAIYPINNSPLPSAKELAGEILERAEDGSITLALQSSMEDAAQLLDNERELFRKKVGHVVLQAGVRADSSGPVLSGRGHLLPDDSFNNACSPEAAEFLYDELQGVGIPTTYVTRHAIRGHVWTEMQVWHHLNHASSVADTLMGRLHESTVALWNIARGTDQHDGHIKLRVRIQDFIEHTYNSIGHYPIDFSNEPTDYARGIPADFIPSYATRFASYDPLAVLACDSDTMSRWMRPTIHTAGRTEHKIIGLNPTDSGLVCPPKIRHELERLQITALTDPVAYGDGDRAIQYSKERHIRKPLIRGEECSGAECDHSLQPGELNYLDYLTNFLANERQKGTL